MCKQKPFLINFDNGYYAWKVFGDYYGCNPSKGPGTHRIQIYSSVMQFYKENKIRPNILSIAWSQYCDTLKRVKRHG